MMGRDDATSDGRTKRAHITVLRCVRANALHEERTWGEQTENEVWDGHGDGGGEGDSENGPITSSSASAPFFLATGALSM